MKRQFHNQNQFYKYDGHLDTYYNLKITNNNGTVRSYENTNTIIGQRSANTLFGYWCTWSSVYFKFRTKAKCHKI